MFLRKLLPVFTGTNRQYAVKLDVVAELRHSLVGAEGDGLETNSIERICRCPVFCLCI